MPKLIDLTGKVFGRLTVLQRGPYVGAKRKHIYWLCRCECGTEKHVMGDNLKSGDIRSCGCLLREFEAAGGACVTHGATRRGSRDPLYYVWAGIVARCYNKANKNFPRYGGRGIKMCARWRQHFDAFRDDVGRKPGSGYSIDRIDNDGDYEPRNVRWADHFQQANNRRPRGPNVKRPSAVDLRPSL